MFLVNKYNIKLYCWIIVVLILVWQLIFSSFSFFSNIALFLLFLCNYLTTSNNKKKYYLLLLWGIAGLAGYSFVLQNEVGLIIRFSLIVFFVLGAYLIDGLNHIKVLKTLIYLVTSLSGLLILSEILLLFFYGDQIGIIRMNFLESGWGDVYFYHFYYKIQIKGNSIIPFTYMLICIMPLFPRKETSILRMVLLLALLIAGNFAFILTIIVFHTVFYLVNSKNNYSFSKRITCLMFLFILFGGFFISYVLGVLDEKKDVSNKVRIDQAMVLLQDLQETPITLFWGKGLGNTVDVITNYRDYRDATYYELQVLYIFNQLGILPFVLFLCLNVYFTFKYIPNKKLQLIYSFYIMYAITNPYVLDTNHIVVIVSLLCAQEILHAKKTYEKRYNMCISSL